MKRIQLLTLLIFFFLGQTALHAASSPGAGSSPADIDRALRSMLSGKISIPAQPAPPPPAKVELGRLLFFDKILSGGKNISCAGCHWPEAGTSDLLPLSAGAGGKGKMTLRQPPLDKNGKEIFVRRNSPDIFNRGEFKVMFWDGRVTNGENNEYLPPLSRELLANGKIVSPAGYILPDGLDSVLAAQAMFPPASDVEMRGAPHDNPLANLEDWQYEELWQTLTARLLDIPEYLSLFRKAYPDLTDDQFTFVQAANAIAAFEIAAFTFYDTPFDLYLGGDNQALSVSAKRGALLFYGEAQCASCHSGHLFTDQLFHNRVVPQIGPGTGDLPGGGPDGSWDAGRGGVTGLTRDYHRFRTPPLRNVISTGPWMHDGIYSTLEATVRHELNPLQAAATYDPSKHLSPRYAQTYRHEQTAMIAKAVKPTEIKTINASDEDVADILSFLKALTSPQLADLTRVTPKTVPSSLPVDD